MFFCLFHVLSSWNFSKNIECVLSCWGCWIETIATWLSCCICHNFNRIILVLIGNRKKWKWISCCDYQFGIWTRIPLGCKFSDARISHAKISSPPYSLSPSLPTSLPSSLPFSQNLVSELKRCGRRNVQRSKISMPLASPTIPTRH